MHSKLKYAGQLRENRSKRIIFKGTDSALHHMISNNILYIEKVLEGRYSIIHTETEDIECYEKTSHFKENYKNFFIEPHISYLVKPLHVKKIERFKITLTNNVIIPIPEKRYTSFKKEFKNWMTEYNKL